MHCLFRGTEVQSCIFCMYTVYRLRMRPYTFMVASSVHRSILVFEQLDLDSSNRCNTRITTHNSSHDTMRSDTRFVVLAAKGRPPPQHVFMILQLLPDRGRRTRPKHVADIINSTNTSSALTVAYTHLRIWWASLNLRRLPINWQITLRRTYVSGAWTVLIWLSMATSGQLL